MEWRDCVSKDFESLEALERYVLDKAKEAMMNEVATVIKKEQSQQVKREVYEKFEPVEYERREDDGGLSDIRNMETTIRSSTHSVTVTVKNKTKGNSDYGNNPNDKYIDGIIASGQGYQYHGVNSKKTYERPRPVDEYTTDELERTKRHVSALIQGLKSRGIDAE